MTHINIMYSAQIFLQEWAKKANYSECVAAISDDIVAQVSSSQAHLILLSCSRHSAYVDLKLQLTSSYSWNPENVDFKLQAIVDPHVKLTFMYIYSIYSWHLFTADLHLQLTSIHSCSPSIVNLHLQLTSICS